MPKGTLVAILNPNDGDSPYVRDHGTLWIVGKLNDPDDAPDGIYDCKSLATGFEYYWYPSEMTPQEGTTP